MQRIMMKTVGKLKVGTIYDYPLPTWRQIATTAKMPITEFSRSVEDHVTQTLNVNKEQRK